jgi:glycolate oxidase FAD binding subunit
VDPLAALREVVGEAARPATGADTVCGVAARFVVAPASTAETSAVIRAAAQLNLSLVVRGAGTKQDWGNPPSAVDLLLDTTRITGVVEHAAGDLIAVVRAGTPLADLQALGNQQLALDAPIAGATIGGTVAANTSGPRRMAYGTVRDLIIGVTFVRADGVVAKAGGKVVKNVAGYDLAKLMTGSYGTLGVITECAFRLHPRPVAAATVLARAGSPDEVGVLLRAVLGARLAPSAVEVDAPAAGGFDVSVQVVGVPVGVEQRAEAAARLTGGARHDAPEWTYPWCPGDVGLKLTTPLSRVPMVLRAVLHARETYDVALAVRGSIGTGVLYGGMPEHRNVAAVVADLRAVCDSVIVLTAPATVRERLDMWGPVPGLNLMRQIKARFDPDGRFAAGRFVGGL